MARTLTTAEWIEKAQSIHADRYDYRLVDYKNAKTKVIVICPEHDEWLCLPDNHISKGRGCPKCGGSLKKSSSDFVNDAQRVHGSKYDYSMVEYINSHTKVKIICFKHGAFCQSPTSHLSGSSCPDCSKDLKLETTRHESINSIQKRINESSDYKVSMIEDSFTSINVRARFMCTEHGEFERLVNTVLYRGNPCLECFRNTENSNVYSQERAEKKLDEVLDSGITYEPFIYHGVDKTIIKLNCSKHGDWESTLARLINNKVNCPQCSEKVSLKKRTEALRRVNQDTLDTRMNSYLEKFVKTHGEKYDYSGMSFVDAKTPIKIICPIHGEFEQTPDSHVKAGCRECANEDLSGLYNERFFQLRPDLVNHPATVYCLELTWEEGHCYKFGITRTNLKKRFSAASANNVKIHVVGMCETTLYKAWEYETLLLAESSHLRYEGLDKKFMRKARISPSELLKVLPLNWDKMIPWSSYPDELL